MAAESLIITCPQCGARNRVPRSRLNQQPLCGKCRTPLSVTNPASNHPIDVSDQNFAEEVIADQGIVLVDCWAPWCGPCRILGPVIDQLASEYAGKIKIAKLNVDENQQTAARYQTMSIPTLLIFRNGKVIDRLIGALPKTEIEQHLKAALS